MSVDDSKNPQAGPPEDAVSAAENTLKDQAGAPAEGDTHVSYSQTTDADHDAHYYDQYHAHEDPYSGQSYQEPGYQEPQPEAASSAAGSSTPPPASPSDDEEEEDEEDDGMLRMSFLDHLEELRKRLISCLMGLGVAFASSLYFAPDIWKAISDPAHDALVRLGYDGTLAQLSPTDAFTTIYMKVPLLVSVFLASPWILWQVWAFIAPGLYKKERRFAGPFVIITAGLFILGGLFAYFVAFGFGLEFLLGVGKDINVKPVVSLVEYFDLFVNVTLGLGIIFELPVIVFFLTFLRITTPKFLLENSRYAILIIVTLAALVTPTADIYNLMIFSVPMVILYFIGVFASYMLDLKRENRRFPWASLFIILAALAALVGGIVWAMVAKYGYKLVNHWPFVIR